MKKSFLIKAVVLTAFLLLSSVCIGAVFISPRVLFSPSDSIEKEIFLNLRLPRVLLAFFAGTILAQCGAVYQSVFRNPLASPFTLGISSGAAIGAMLAIIFNLFYGLSFFLSVLCAFVSILIIQKLAAYLKGEISIQLLLSGIIFNFFCSSFILFLEYISDFTEVFRITRWLMGSLETQGYQDALIVGCISIIGFFFFQHIADELTILSVGSEFASSKGVDTEKITRKIFLFSSLSIGVLVSVCGPIGFVGVAVPFMARALTSANYRIMLPMTYFLGGLTLLLCDTIGRTIIAPAEIPVGVITALIGAPVCAAILMRGRR